jgi:hypothetical protein
MNPADTGQLLVILLWDNNEIGNYGILGNVVLSKSLVVFFEKIDLMAQTFCTINMIGVALGWWI